MLIVTHIFYVYGEYLIKEVLYEIGDYKIGGKISNRLRFVDDTAIIDITQQELATR